MNIIVAALTVSEKSSNISKKRLVHWRNYFKPICGPSFWLHIKNFHARYFRKHFCRQRSLFVSLFNMTKSLDMHGWGGDRGSEPSEKSRHHRFVNEIPFQWRFTGGRMVAHLEKR